MATGSSPRVRRMSARAIARAVLPTPVGPKTARTVGGGGIARSVGCRAMDVSGKTVLVTGATGGLGQAIARAFAGRGAKLMLTGWRTEVLKPLAGELSAQVLAIDLADADDVQRLIDASGDVDVLLANAALPASGRIE